MGKMKKKIELTPEQEQQIYGFENYVRNHGQPVTRRQFLAAGAILSTASIVLPSALSFISQLAHAEGGAAPVCKGSVGKLPGFYSINLAGGASLAGNALAKDKNGGYLQTYRPVGLGTTTNALASAERRFGDNGPDFYSVGGFMTGLKVTAPVDVLNKTAVLLVCVRSTDDSANNQLDASAMIAKAKGGSGAFLPPLGANRNQSAVLTQVPALAVNSVADIQNAIGVQGAVQALTSSQKEKIFKMVQRLSDAQSRTLATESGGALLGNLVKDATGINTGLIGNPSSGTDPQGVQGLANVWNFNDNNQLRDAGVVMNILRGHTVCGSTNMGGFDYHNQGRTVQDTRDNGAGQMVGRALATAAVMNEKICVVVTSDGSVGHALDPAPGSGPTGDQGTHGMAYAFFFDPAGRPDQTASQVGGFTSAATNAGDRVGVDESTLVGGSPASAMAAIVANYLSFAGQVAMVESVAPRIFTTEQLDSQIIKIS